MEFFFFRIPIAASDLRAAWKDGEKHIEAELIERTQDIFNEVNLWRTFFLDFWSCNVEEMEKLVTGGIRDSLWIFSLNIFKEIVLDIIHLIIFCLLALQPIRLLETLYFVCVSSKFLFNFFILLSVKRLCIGFLGEFMWSFNRNNFVTETEYCD